MKRRTKGRKSRRKRSLIPPIVFFVKYKIIRRKKRIENLHFQSVEARAHQLAKEPAQKVISPTKVSRQDFICRPSCVISVTLCKPKNPNIAGPLKGGEAGGLGRALIGAGESGR